MLSLAEVAELVGGRSEGPDDLVLGGVAPLEQAGPAELGFFAMKRYARHLGGSRAAAFLVAADLESLLPTGAPRVVVTDAHEALRRLLEHFHPPAPFVPGVHRTVVLGSGVRLAGAVRIDAYSVLGDDVEVGEGARVGAHCVLGAGSSVGQGCTLHPHVVLYPGAVVGSGVTLHSGVRVGSDGFGYATAGGTPRKMPQVGRAIIEDDVEIGANTTIDRGSLGDTVVGRGAKIDNLVQIAHNVRVGAATLIAALVGIAGSTRIGRGVWLGGASSAINHLEIGDGARVTFASTVMRDVPAGETVSGTPARPHREHLRSQALVARLEQLVERVERLERALGAAGQGTGDGGETRGARR